MECTKCRQLEAEDLGDNCFEWKCKAHKLKTIGFTDIADHPTKIPRWCPKKLKKRKKK